MDHKVTRAALASEGLRKAFWAVARRAARETTVAAMPLGSEALHKASSEAALTATTRKAATREAAMAASPLVLVALRRASSAADTEIRKGAVLGAKEAATAVAVVAAA